MKLDCLKTKIGHNLLCWANPWCSVTLVGQAAISTCWSVTGHVENRPECAGIGAAVERVRHDVIHRLGPKRRPQVLLMSRLPASFPLLVTLGQRLLRLDDVVKLWPGKFWLP